MKGVRGWDYKRYDRSEKGGTKRHERSEMVVLRDMKGVKRAGGVNPVEEGTG